MRTPIATLSGILTLSLFAAPGDWPVLKTYEGEYLRRVKMPLGGIGTGTVSLSGRGALVDWEIRNHADKGHLPTVNAMAASGFWLRTEDSDGRVVARILEGPLDTETYEGEIGCMTPNYGFPRFRSCTFRVAYPLAQVALGDPDVPVAATLEATNPLVTGDAEASGIPAVLLRWRLVNRTDRPLKASVLGFLVNPSAGGCVTQVVTNGVRGASLGVADSAPVNDDIGRTALTVPAGAGDVSVAAKIADLGWKVRMDLFWKQFLARGRADDLRDGEAKNDLSAVAVAVTVTLPPKGEGVVPFALSWRFPHRRAWSGRYHDETHGAFETAKDVGNHYASVYADEVAPAATLFAELPALEEKTVRFVRRVLAYPAPDVVKEAALFNLSTLRTETCFRTADGHFYGWEGVFDHGGSCYGNCSHVWGYEHALVDLWPSLAKDMTELQYGPQMDDRGHISFRVGLPLKTNARSTIACADGQMQCAIKAYEIWKKTGDDAWLRRLYPRIRKSIEFCWIPGGWDADRDGVMEGCQHNTMDVEYYGPNPQMEFLYLAALRALAAMSEANGDAAFGAACRDLAAKGSAWTEKNLFNGEWYEHQVVPPRVTPAVGIGGCRDVSKLRNPNYQLAAGCLVDQLLGDYAARHVGLGPVADETHAGTALTTILAKNASANVGDVYNCGRAYALPEEPALKMAWYPHGRMPPKPFPYYGENMTGFEYVVAANLVHRGRLAEAEKVVRDIRSRYDGKKRSPFDEAECGHHYARALAAWSVLTDWPQTGN